MRDEDPPPWESSPMSGSAVELLHAARNDLLRALGLTSFAAMLFPRRHLRIWVEEIVLANAAADARLSAACTQLGVPGPPVEIIPSVLVTDFQGTSRVSVFGVWRVRRWIKRRRRLVESMLRLDASSEVSSAPYR